MTKLYMNGLVFKGLRNLGLSSGAGNGTGGTIKNNKEYIYEKECNGSLFQR